MKDKCLECETLKARIAELEEELRDWQGDYDINPEYLKEWEKERRALGGINEEMLGPDHRVNISMGNTGSSTKVEVEESNK